MASLLFFTLTIGIIAVIGGAVAYLFRDGKGGGVTRTEYLVVLLLACVIVIPTVSFVGTKIAKNSALTHYEYWNGLEATAPVSVTRCERDGSCVHTYDCDEYQEYVTHYRTEYRTRPATRQASRSVPDGNGGTRTEYYTEYYTETYTVQVPYQVLETFYHDCPYVTEEYSYSVTDTLGGSQSYASHIFPASASNARWTGEGHNDPRSGSGMPGLPNVAQGEPSDWAAVRDRIEAGKPGGVTVRKDYKDYVLASSEDSYEDQREAIDAYRDLGLMPTVVKDTGARYSADKVYNMGTGINEADWQYGVQRFNGYFGGERQGDLHLVIVSASKVGSNDADKYSAALEAYWRSKALGKNTLAKNAVAVVIGLSGSEVQWARAFTGMPKGNEGMVSALREDLPGGKASPADLLEPETGLLYTVMVSGPDSYSRVEMAGYEHLYDNVGISTGARIWILLIAVLFSGLLWAGALALDLRFHPLENLKLDKVRARMKPKAKVEEAEPGEDLSRDVWDDIAGTTPGVTGTTAGTYTPYDPARP